MRADDVTETLDRALVASGLNGVAHRPRLLSDNGSSYIAADLAGWLENYYLPGDPEACIGAFVDHYNHWRYHESLNNLTPADVYFRRAQAILQKRENIKRRTIELRRLQHANAAA